MSPGTPGGPSHPSFRALVGAILNFSIWFAVHTIFGAVSEQHRFGVRLLIPDWATIDVVALSIAAAALVAMFRFKVGMLPTLAASAAAGLLYRLVV
jgi:chromate transporter